MSTSLTTTISSSLSTQLNTSEHPLKHTTLPSLPIEWISTYDTFLLPNICLLPQPLFQEFQLSSQTWLEIQLESFTSFTNEIHLSKLLCRCSCHTNPTKSFATILGPTIQTYHPDSIPQGTIAKLISYEYDALPKLKHIKISLLSSNSPLFQSPEILSNNIKALSILRELDQLFIKSDFIIHTPSFQLKILWTSPASGGLVTPWTRVDIITTTPTTPTSSYSSSLNYSLPLPETLVSPPGLEIIFPKLTESISTAIRQSCPKKILIHGPSGVGKSYAVHQLAQLFHLRTLEFQATDFQNDIISSSETQLRQTFQSYSKSDPSLPPLLLVFKSIDLMISSHRVLPFLLSQFDLISSVSVPVIIISTTHHFSELPTSLTRSGRFDHLLSMDPPTLQQRKNLLTTFLNNHECVISPKDDSFIEWLAQSTSGYVASDLLSLVQTYPNTNEFFDRSLWMQTLKKVPPSLTKHHFLNLDRSLTWDSVAGLDLVKEQLKRYVLWPRLYPDQFQKLGLHPPQGILLYGPPGCSKTTLAKILAVHSGYHFFALSAASILDSHVGESERQLRQSFQLAHQVGPSIVFLDEIEVLGQRQGREDTKIMSTLLNLMDGIDSKHPSDSRVVVLGATNYPDKLDPALIRVGRFDRLIYIGPPNKMGRKEIFQLYLSRSSSSSSFSILNLDLDELAEKTKLATGAEIENICRQACLYALREGAEELKASHLYKAIADWKPLLNKATLDYYRAMQLRFSST